MGNKVSFATAGLALATTFFFPTVASAATLLSDNFNTENGGAFALLYGGFANWNVTNGNVDLVANGASGTPNIINGLFVDLNGTVPGTLTSQQAYSFNAGDTVLTETHAPPLSA